MRVLLAVFLMVLGAVPAVAGSQSDFPAAPPILVRDATAAPGALSFSVIDESEIPFAAPIVRLAVIPDGAVDPRIEIDPRAEAAGDGAAAGFAVTAGPPMILRGLRVMPVVITVPDREPEGNGGPTPAKLNLTLRYSPAAGSRSGAGSGVSSATVAPPSAPVLRRSRGFFEPFADLLVGGPPQLLGSGAEGGYLVITVPEYVETLEPLLAWKREMGYDVVLATTDEIGSANSDILEFIRGRYESASPPPQYVLLVGDIEEVPTWDYHSNVSDLPYSLLDGDDFLPDLEVGRLSVRTVEQAEVVVAKLLGYEKSPYREEGDEWFSRALMVAADYSSSTPVAVAKWCGEQLLASGYNEIPAVYFPPHWGDGPARIKEQIDPGVSIVAYRGWAYGWRGWEPPKFTVDEIPTLANGWKLPAVFSFVCQNNAFNEVECFGEAWLRAGTVEEPKGGVAFIGNSEHWSHTRYNDAAAIGAFQAIRQDGARKLGDILTASKLEILRQFPSQLLYETNADESVEFYFYIYSLLGDPGMEIWMGAPRPVEVAHDDAFAQGSTLLEVAVHEEDGVTPVEGARVGFVLGDGSQLGSARTDADGAARLTTRLDQADVPVRITVTGTGLLPVQEDVPVNGGGPYLSLEGVEVDDDTEGSSQGNGDGVPNPGETLELRLTLRNRGTDPAEQVSALLECLRGAEVEVGAADFADLAPGGDAANDAPFLLHVPEDAEDRAVVPLRLQVSSSTGPSVSGFDLSIQAPDLRYASHEFDGDGVWDPGEASSLAVTLRNDGSLAAGNGQAVLRSLTPAIATVADSISTFAAVGAGETAALGAPFVVRASGEAGIGQAAVFRLTTTTGEGYVRTSSFSVVIGQVDHRAPLGPDPYGYYAYDSSDTDYPDAVPTFDWVTCSTAYGGSGTPLDLGDNETVNLDLPFPFTYYGQTYRRLMVSDNGWASFDTTAFFDFYNWSIPTSYGSASMIAPFWDNLDPDKAHDGVPVGDGVYALDDPDGHRFIVEWSRLGNLRSQHEEDHREDYDDLQTFELILFDPAYRTTPTGDGVIRFQYKQVVNNDTDRMYSTVGIEDATETRGLEYTYSDLYPPAAAPLSAGLAIEFTTAPPHYRPFRLVSLSAAACDSGVCVSWMPVDDRVLDGYRVYRGEPGDEFEPIAGGAVGPEARSFLDRGADPSVACRYRIGAVDGQGRESFSDPFEYRGMAAPERLRLAVRGPTPLAGSGELAFSVPRRGLVGLRIFDLAGRLVRTLIDGELAAGAGTARWDGRDDYGRQVPSGVYFSRIESGGERRLLKLTLVR